MNSVGSELEKQIGLSLRDGDYPAAAAAMIRGYGSEILGYLLGMTRDAAAADEVFSLVSEDLWCGLPGFRREASARTWLYRIAYHAVQRYRRDPFRKRQKPLSAELDGALAEVRSQTAPFLRTEFKDAIARLREQLSADEQTLLILRIDRGLSWSEVGDVMKKGERAISEATVAKRFERLRHKLRRLAEREGLLPSD